MAANAIEPPTNTIPVTRSPKAVFVCFVMILPFPKFVQAFGGSGTANCASMGLLT
jgi:hypothetical protein